MYEIVTSEGFPPPTYFQTAFRRYKVRKTTWETGILPRGWVIPFLQATFQVQALGLESYFFYCLSNVSELLQLLHKIFHWPVHAESYKALVYNSLGLGKHIITETDFNNSITHTQLRKLIVSSDVQRSLKTAFPHGTWERHVCITGITSWSW